MRNANILIIPLLILGSCSVRAQDTAASEKTNPGPAAQTSDNSSPDLGAIEEQSREFVTAFNAHDADKISKMWSEDGEYIDEYGNRFVGREQIKKTYSEFFAENADAKLQLAIDSLRLVSPTVAIEDGHAVADPAEAAAGVSSYTAVHVKSDGKWLMASVRDAWIEAPPSVRSAADLQWLVGSWVAEEHGVRIDSECRWVASNRFIERTYTSTQHDGSKTSGIQLIGWNPAGGYVQSWEFSPDGGHAVGIWYPTDSGWAAEVQGITGDGVATSAVNHLVRLDDNAYAWQSVERYLGETALPDTDEVVIKRSKQEGGSKADGQ